MLRDLTESKRQLANQRHNLKNQLVKLKAQDDLTFSLMKQIQFLRDNHDSQYHAEKLTQWAHKLTDLRANTRHKLNAALDTMERVNPKV